MNIQNSEKQKIVLKALIMLAYTRQFERRVRKVRADLYHRPLMMTLVNSVNTEDADLKLFFRELVRIGSGGIDKETWNSAQQELRSELRDHPAYLFEPDARVQVNDALLDGLTQADLLRDVFNANGPGEIEVLVRPSDRQEVAFKLKPATIRLRWCGLVTFLIGSSWNWPATKSASTLPMKATSSN